MLSLAQELIDTVLDFLHDDAESLRRSSLVAHAWIPTPRHHLFSHTAINCFFSGRATVRDNAHSFLALCGSPHRTILAAMQSVALNIIHFGDDPELLERVVGAFEGTSVKEIFFLDWSSPGSLARIGARLPQQLEQLSYNSMAQASEDLFFLAASFPRLRSLVIHVELKSIMNTTIVFPPLPTTNLTHLRTLRLRLSGHHLEQALSWLQAAGVRPETLDVEVLHCFHNGWGPTASLNAFLHARAGRLEHLHLRVAHHRNSSDIDDIERLNRVSDVDLRVLANLRTLHLRSHDLESVCTALDSLPKDFPTLETVKVDTIPYPFDHDDDDGPT
ncbi:hypothetical protein DFH09DRAFT_1325652 [Mycena vulgaris]|nr:hypothetical protein DFH09DRAFT_1325652 [Mycena vulgaris]